MEKLIMSLLKGTARESLESFNPKEDNPNNAYSNVPAGEYDAVLVNTEHKVFDSGWEAFSIELGFVGGEYDGRKEFINIGFRGEKIPEFVYNKNIKLVAQLAFVCGLELTDEDWDDEDNLTWAFKPALGSQFLVNISETKNKKDPSNPYRNFVFESYAEEPTTGPVADTFEKNTQTIEINEDDIPF